MNDIVWAPEADDAAVAEHIERAVGTEGGLIAVPGGRTPWPILRRLAERALPWVKITVTLTDDREIPYDHPASNFGGLRTALEGTGATLRPLEEGPAPGPARLVWVGMGNDGHVASIFPNMAISPDEPPAVLRAVPNPLPSEAPFPRLTLNYAALVDTDELIIVARGEEKGRLLRAAEAQSVDLPIARLLAAAKSRVTLFWSSE